MMKKVLKFLLGFLLVLVTVVVGYFGYLSLTFYRIDDNVSVETNNNGANKLSTLEEYSMVTFNVGFGAYSDEYSFFMDYGVMEDGTEVTGYYGKGMSEEDVRNNVNGTKELLEQNNADFYLLQEVDTDSDRSYHINMSEIYQNTFSDYASVYTSNFHSGFLAYPFHDMHGTTNAGLLTLSDYQITENVRRQYPIDMSFFAKFFDLDRCFLMSRLPVDNGKELVIINSHMSAYDEGGLIRVQQLALLNSVMEEEYAKGNYVIVGGDFNHDLVDSIGKFPTKQLTPEWVSSLSNNDLVDGMSIVKADNAYEVATCRAAEMPYLKGINYEVVVDGFIVSDNIDAVAHNVDGEYLYSDHNPVYLTFTLK